MFFFFFFFWPPVKLHFLEFTPHVPAYFVEIILANLLAVGKTEGREEEGRRGQERKKKGHIQREKESEHIVMG